VKDNIIECQVKEVFFQWVGLAQVGKTPSMVRCIDCGLFEYPFFGKVAGRCLWYERAIQHQQAKAQRECQIFEERRERLKPIKHLELKLRIMSADKLQTHPNRVGRAVAYLRKAIETERLRDFDDYVGEARDSLCNDDLEPLQEYEFVARQIGLVSSKVSELLSEFHQRRDYEWYGRLGRDFGKDPDQFYLTYERRIIWAKHSKYFRSKKRRLFLSIPFDRLILDSDELIDLMERTVNRAPMTKEILDRRAEQGARGDVGAVLASLASEDADRFIPLCKLALESQKAARSEALREFKRMLEPILIELTELEKGRPQIPPNTHDQNSKILFELENSLRKHIVAKLKEAYCRDWWEKGVPDDVKHNAKKRKETRLLPLYYPKREYHEIYYADFSDYTKIILRKDNWNAIFKPYFKNRELTAATLAELNPIRNDIAHSREIDEVTHLVLFTNATKILRALTPI